MSNVSKSGIYALADTYIVNKVAAITALETVVGQKISEKSLNDFIQTEIDNGRIIFCEYEQGIPKQKNAFDEKKTIAKAVKTCFKNSYGSEIYAVLKKNKFDEWSKLSFGTMQDVLNRLNTYIIGNISFKTFCEANDFMKELHVSLLPGEKWSFGANNDCWRKTDFPVLESYIKIIFDILCNEYDNPSSLNYRKLVFSSDDKYCIFNSGLLSRFASDIIILGEVFRRKNGVLSLNNPRIVLKGMKELEVLNFSFADASNWQPSLVGFFNNINDILFDSKKVIDWSDSKVEHIVEENRDRFPDNHRNYDSVTLVSKLYTACNKAKSIALRNYKYVIPQYRPEKNGGKIQFLMPIYLDGDFSKSADFVLVLDSQSSYYVPETVLTLAMAYSNARLICKPDDFWLKPELIKPTSADVNEDFDD